MNDAAPSTQTKGPPPSVSLTASSPQSRSRLERLKDVASILQSVFTVIAFVVAAWWFLHQREVFPRAAVTHTVSERLLTAEWRWVRLSVHVSNVGFGALNLKSGKIWLEKILPLEDEFIAQLARGEDLVSTDSQTVKWRRLGDSYEAPPRVVIEPGESQDIAFEFIVPSRVRTVRAYSYFENQSNPNLGWRQTTIHDLLSRKEEP